MKLLTERVLIREIAQRWEKCACGNPGYPGFHHSYKHCGTRTDAANRQGYRLTPPLPSHYPPNEGNEQMSEAKHTPGPWVSVYHDEETWRVYRNGKYGEGSYAVADVINGNGEPQNRANARLIAAAPEHHEASLSTVERLADLPRFLREENNRALAEIVEEELAKHRAAIAKASA